MSAYELAELLRGRVCGRAAVLSSGGACELLACEANGLLLYIALARAPTGHWYAKATPVEVGSCNSAFLNPYGLYVFSTSLEGVASGIAAKLPRLRAIARLAEERGHL